MALFCSFFPAFTFYAGSLNNDILSSFLTLLSIYFFFVHLREDKKRYVILSALFLGLSGLVKISAIPFYVGSCLFYISAVLMRQTHFKKALKNISLFSAVCLPILFLYPVYNFIRWDGFSIFSTHVWWSMGSWSEVLSVWFSKYHPFLYLADVSVDKYQYVGTYSLLDRLGPVFVPITRPFLFVGNGRPDMIPEYNIWAGLLKTALFDEWHLFFTGFGNGYAMEGATVMQTIGFDLSMILFVLGWILFFFFLVAFFKVSRKEPIILYCQSVTVAVMAGFVYWCLKNPASSAVSFRYIAFLFPILSLFVVKYVQENLSRPTKGNERIKNFLGLTVFLFSWTALIIYTLYGATSI